MRVRFDGSKRPPNSNILSRSSHLCNPSTGGLFKLEFTTNNSTTDVSWDVWMILEESNRTVSGGNYKTAWNSTTFQEIICLPLDQCYQLQIRSEESAGLVHGMYNMSSSCDYYKAEHDGQRILEGDICRKNGCYVTLPISSPMFGTGCPPSSTAVHRLRHNVITTTPPLPVFASPLDNLYRDHRYLQQNDFWYFIPLLFYLFACGGGCICLCCCCSWCMAKNISDEDDDNDAANPSNSPTNGAPNTGTNTGEEPNNTTNELQEQQDREERRLFILTNILVEHHNSIPHSEDQWNDELEGDKANLEGIKKRSKQRLFQARRRNSISGKSITMPRDISISKLQNNEFCSICLEAYDISEEICSSKNKMCHHKFHLDCMVSWLMDHDECPICRLPYLMENDGINAQKMDSNVEEGDTQEVEEVVARMIDIEIQSQSF